MEALCYVLMVIDATLHATPGDIEAGQKAVANLNSPKWKERAEAEKVLRQRRHRYTAKLHAPKLYRAELMGDLNRLMPPSKTPCADAAWYSPDRQSYMHPEHDDLFAMVFRPFLKPELDKLQPLDGYPFTDYQQATVDWVVNLMDMGMPDWALRPVITEMQRRDSAYFMHCWRVDRFAEKVNDN